MRRSPTAMDRQVSYTTNSAHRRRPTTTQASVCPTLRRRRRPRTSSRSAAKFDGETNAAISALRDVLEGRRVGELPPPEPTKPIEVTSIEVLDGSGTRSKTISAGSAMTVRVHVRALASLPRWAVGFSIDTPAGQMVLASNTERLGLQLGPVPAGDSHLDFAIASANFGAGEYYVNANVSEVIDIDSHVLWQGRGRNLGSGHAGIDIIEGATARRCRPGAVRQRRRGASSSLPPPDPAGELPSAVAGGAKPLPTLA